VDNKEFKKKLIKRAYKYSLEIINFIDSIVNKKDFSSQIISKQLLRSATSIGANIVESQAASSKRDFTNFLNHALKSANESKFWLGLLRDSNKASKSFANKLLAETTELAKILGSSILTIRGKRKF